MDHVGSLCILTYDARKLKHKIMNVVWGNFPYFFFFRELPWWWPVNVRDLLETIRKEPKCNGIKCTVLVIIIIINSVRYNATRCDGVRSIYIFSRLWTVIEINSRSSSAGEHTHTHTHNLIYACVPAHTCVSCCYVRRLTLSVSYSSNTALI